MYRYLRFILFAILLMPLMGKSETILRRSIGSDVASFDPQSVYGRPTAHVLMDIYEGLIGLGMCGEVVSGVAEKWETNEDGLSYIFHLRDSYWSDGSPVTAEDFVYSWRRAVNPETNTSYKFLFHPIKNAKSIISGEEKDIAKLGVQAIDDKTFKVQLAYPAPYLLKLLSHPIFYPIKQQKNVDKKEQWKNPRNIITNGAYTIQEWNHLAFISLKKSETYWDKNSVSLDKVIYYPIEDRNKALKRFQSGELDWIQEIPINQEKFIVNHLSDSYVNAPFLAVYYYGFNLKKEPFKNNLKLRKALSLAINREVLVDSIIGSGEMPAYNLIVPETGATEPYIPDYKNLSQNECNKLAKQLYKEAGYSNKNPLEINFIYNTNDNHKNIITAITAMWKEVLGVKVNIRNMEWNAYLNYLDGPNTNDYDLFRFGYIGDYDDGNTFLSLFSTGSDFNNVGFSSQKYDALLEQANQEYNMEKRKEIMYQAEKELIDSYAILPLYFYTTKRLINPKLKGYKINVMDYSRSKYMYFEEE